MITVLALAAFVLAVLWLTHDRDGLDFGARDIHRAMAARDRRTGPGGTPHSPSHPTSWAVETACNA